MAVITSGAHPKALWPGVKAFFGKSYAEKKLIALDVFDTMSSDGAYEEYQEETGMTAAQIKAEGSAVTYVTDAQGYTSRLINVTYGLGAKITQEAIEDNKYEAVAKSKAKPQAKASARGASTVLRGVPVASNRRCAWPR